MAVLLILISGYRAILIKTSTIVIYTWVLVCVDVYLNQQFEFQHFWSGKAHSYQDIFEGEKKKRESTSWKTCNKAIVIKEFPLWLSSNEPD